jgi:hypothetical protein
MYRRSFGITQRITRAEEKYSTMELETYAIWLSVTTAYRSITEGNKFVLETHYRPLLLLLMKKPYESTLIEQWMNELQQYDMILTYTPQ